MKKTLLLCLTILCLASSGIGVAARLYDTLWPVVILLHDGTDKAELKNILLVVIHSSTGKAMKVTLNPDLFPFEDFEPKNPESIADCLRIIEEQLPSPLALDAYVVLGLNTLDSLEPGAAKEKGPLELVRLGLSLLGSVETNLPITQAISTFQQAFAQKDGGIELSLPEKADAQYTPEGMDWDAMGETLNRALDELQDPT